MYSLELTYRISNTALKPEEERPTAATEQAVSALKPHNIISDATNNAAPDKTVDGKNRKTSISKAPNKLKKFLFDLLSSVFPSMPDIEEDDSDKIVSAYLALETKNPKKADQLLLKYINSNSPLCLDTLPDQKLYDFFSRKGDEIYTLSLSGEKMPEDLITTLKLKCPNLKELKIICDSFYQPVRELDSLTHLEVISKFFDQPVEKLKNLTHLVIKSQRFNQFMRCNLDNLTHLEIESGPFDMPVEQLTKLTYLKITNSLFDQSVEKLDNLIYLEIESDEFNQPVEKLKNVTHLKIEGWSFNQPVEKLENVTYLELDCLDFNQPIEKLIERGTKCVVDSDDERPITSTKNTVSALKPHDLVSDATSHAAPVKAFDVKNRKQSLSEAPNELKNLPSELLSLIFSFMPGIVEKNDFWPFEKGNDDPHKTISAYLALAATNLKNADQFLLKYLNTNAFLCLDTLPKQKLYDFFSREGDKIHNLALSGTGLSMPENLITTLKLKCPNLKELKIDCPFFFQSVEELVNLTHLEIDSSHFNRPVEKLKKLIHLKIKSVEFNQPVEELDSLTHLKIVSSSFNQSVEKLKNLIHFEIDGGNFNHPVEKLKKLKYFKCYCMEFKQPVEELKKRGTECIVDAFDW
ncbi:MAG: hypothetical protein WAM28_03055 [Chlamydiales bacterium]